MENKTEKDFFCMLKNKYKTKKSLCFMLERELGIKRTARDISIIEYDKIGYIESFSLKLGSSFIGVSYFSSTNGYMINKDLTFKLNDV